jgi:chaperone modulatory protein CbpM
MGTTEPVLSGIILDEHAVFSLYELSAACKISVELLIEMVEEGIVSPAGKEPRNWTFCGLDVLRIHTAIRLQRDLRVNLAGAALALDLLAEIERLKGRFDTRI